MFTIEIGLKNVPLPLMVLKKSEEEARETYQQVVNALNTGDPVLLELNCDQVQGKRLTVLVSAIAVVQMYEKSATSTSSGKPPGFFSLMSEVAQG